MLSVCKPRLSKVVSCGGRRGQEAVIGLHHVRGRILTGDRSCLRMDHKEGDSVNIDIFISYSLRCYLSHFPVRNNKVFHTKEDDIEVCRSSKSSVKSIILEASDMTYSRHPLVPEP